MKCGNATRLKLKAEHWVIQFYFRKIALHQQKCFGIFDFFSFTLIAEIFLKCPK